MPEDPLRRLLADPPALPVVSGLGEVATALEARGVVVVQAPPGSGKTTLVPPVVALSAGRVVVTAPRRIAARAAARRLASLLDEPVGKTVGYTVRGDRRASARTRIEVVTTGVLLRRVQRDPALPGIDAVVLDEVHERTVDTDLALALLIDVRAHLRDDLALVAMSATIEAERTASLIGAADPAPVVTVPGALHPVETIWVPPPPGVKRLDDRGVTPGFLDHVASCARQALLRLEGDVLVFVPGAAEVGGVVRRLAELDEVDVLPLHGRLSSGEQDRVFARGRRRKVIVSTAVAESSLTVPGVRSVVDGGLSREPRTNHQRGLAGLVTVRVSRAAADQRAGRAGREGPGAVLRCWSETEHTHLAAHAQPEIATADLSSFALELAVWGSHDGEGLAFLDRPPRVALDAAHETLTSLGALDAHGRVTEKGRAIARLATDPRLARALLDGAEAVGSRRAAEVVALLSDGVRAPGGDLVAALRHVRRGGADRTTWAATSTRLQASLPTDRRDRPGEPGLGDDLAVGTIVALAHPDRIARRRPASSGFLMTSGTGAVLARGDAALAAQTWLAVADVERRPGERDATIRSAAPLDESLALEAAASRWHDVDEVVWDDGRIVARRVTRLGAIELASTPLTEPDPAHVAAAVQEGFRRHGLDLLRWGEAATSLRQRLAFLHRTLGDPWPDVSTPALTAGIESWVGPDLARVRSSRDLARIDVLSALRRLLPWPEAGRLDDLAPERITLPSGSRVRIDYSQDQPVVAVRIQETFGWQSPPRLADDRVPLLLHLLSPARRPVAVTADLASFWASGYHQVRAELRGRYPKHAWPDDPTVVPPPRTRR